MFREVAPIDAIITSVNRLGGVEGSKKRGAACCCIGVEYGQFAAVSTSNAGIFAR